MIDELIDLVGDRYALALGGALIGLAFGVLAQRSRFCLRSATLEVARGDIGERLAVWLFVFATALIVTQAFIVTGLLDTGTVRQLSNRGSLSGSIVGGLLFGSGMTLSRGCASRMVVMAATGNLRALLSGLIFAVVAEMSLNGVLAPLRTAIGDWWTVEANSRNLLALFHLGHVGAIAFAALWLALGVSIALQNKTSLPRLLAGAGVGVTVALAWAFTYAMSTHSFDPTPVQALSFTSPSAALLMFSLSPSIASLNFDLAIVPGVFVGALLAGAVGRELKLEGFHDGETMRRYIIGGCLMGFGGVLAGGCAVGAGVSGASVFALTAWIVLWSMWIGAVLTDWSVG